MINSLIFILPNALVATYPQMLNSVYEENNLLKIKGFCESSGIFRKDADEDDLKIIKRVKGYLKKP